MKQTTAPVAGQINKGHEYVSEYYPQYLLGFVRCPVCRELSQQEFVEYESRNMCKPCFYKMLGMTLPEKEEEADRCEDEALSRMEESQIRLGVMFEDMIEGMASRDMARDPFVR